jgi:hypothetical protein
MVQAWRQFKVPLISHRTSAIGKKVSKEQLHKIRRLIYDNSGSAKEFAIKTFLNAVCNH